MKTLYDRLKPELKEALESQKNKYPATVEGVETALINNHYWSDLKVIEAIDLCNLLNKTFIIDSIYYSFNDEEL